MTRAARSGMQAESFRWGWTAAQSKHGSYDRAMPLAIVVTLALLLVPLASSFDGGDEEPPAPRAAVRTGPSRGSPSGSSASAACASTARPGRRRSRPRRRAREGRESLDQDYPPARRAAEAEMLALLGLLPPGIDLGESPRRPSSEAVAGYYDPRSGALRVVEGAQTANRVLYEMTRRARAHPRARGPALRLRRRRLAAGGDGALAYLALVEGSATAVMYRYVDGPLRRRGAARRRRSPRRSQARPASCRRS